jgi:hypothetical protein
MTRFLAKLAFAASALMLGSASANASVMVQIKQNGFGSGPIRVISENGTSWTKIVDSDLILPVQINLGISSGELLSWQIKQGTALIGQTAHYWNPPPHVQETHTVTGSTKNFIFETGIIIGACNNFLNVGNGIHQKHTDFHAVQLELVGNFRMTNGGHYPAYSGYGTVAVPVECMPYLAGSNDEAVGAGGGDGIQSPLLIKEAKLFLTTYTNGQNTGITLGACPTLRTTVRFETNKAGPVTFDLHRFPGSTTSHTVNAEFEAGTGKFYARYQKHESFNTTTSLQYKAQSTSPSAGNTGWKDIIIHCGGGLAPNTSSSNPDNTLPTPAQLKGDFSFLADNGTNCPRKVKALINFTSSVKDNVHYSLDCTNGHFSGVASTAPKPGGGYVAPALVTFDITETTQANCVLKSVAPGAAKVHTLKGRHYQCVKRAVNPASADVTTTPKPGQGSTAPAGSNSAKPGKPKDDASAKRVDAISKKTKIELDAKAKLKAAAEAARRRKAAEKVAADKVKKDLANKRKLLKETKTAKTKSKTADSKSSASRVR